MNFSYEAKNISLRILSAFSERRDNRTDNLPMMESIAWPIGLLCQTRPGEYLGNTVSYFYRHWIFRCDLVSWRVSILEATAVSHFDQHVQPNWKMHMLPLQHNGVHLSGGHLWLCACRFAIR